MDIEEVLMVFMHKKWTHIPTSSDGVHAQRNGHISVGDTDQPFRKSILLLISDIVAELLMSDAWFTIEFSPSKRYPRSHTAYCSIFHFQFIFRVVLKKRQLTLPKTAWKFLFSVHVFLGLILTNSWVDMLQCYINLEYFSIKIIWVFQTKF